MDSYGEGCFVLINLPKRGRFYAWAKHSTPAGVFKDIVVLPKGDETSSEDQLWAVVERVDDSGPANQLERLSVQFSDDLSGDYKPNGRFLDSHVYTAVTTPTDHITVPTRVIQNGKARIVVDGVDLGNVPVSSGGNLSIIHI